MKPKKQLRYLFDKEILEAERRESAQQMSLLLTVLESSGRLLVTDGINFLPVFNEPSKKKKVRSERLEALCGYRGLEPRSTYVFQNCHLKVFPDSEQNQNQNAFKEKEKSKEQIDLVKSGEFSREKEAGKEKEAANREKEKELNSGNRTTVAAKGGGFQILFCFERAVLVMPGFCEDIDREFKPLLKDLSVNELESLRRRVC